MLGQKVVPISKRAIAIAKLRLMPPEKRSRLLELEAKRRGLFRPDFGGGAERQRYRVPSEGLVVSRAHEQPRPGTFSPPAPYETPGDRGQ